MFQVLFFLYSQHQFEEEIDHYFFESGILETVIFFKKILDRDILVLYLSNRGIH